MAVAGDDLQAAMKAAHDAGKAHAIRASIGCIGLYVSKDTWRVGLYISKGVLVVVLVVFPGQPMAVA